jgi:hypothetical protein
MWDVLPTGITRLMDLGLMGTMLIGKKYTTVKVFKHIKLNEQVSTSFDKFGAFF